jgi:hypothetical protein
VHNVVTEAAVEFCGEDFPIKPDVPLTIGRTGDIAIDDNPFMHRRFLQVSHDSGWWWLANVGARLHATVADDQGLMQAWLAPGARLPLVFSRSLVWFSAGPTTYELSITLGTDPPFQAMAAGLDPSGMTTVGGVTFTPDQRLLIIALCEPLIADSTKYVGSIPGSAYAARRLGWPITKFNRKLDNVCDKLTRAGVRGLHGGPDRLAVNRRARLVEYALASRLVGKADLEFLPEKGESSPSTPGALPRHTTDLVQQS